MNKLKKSLSVLLTLVMLFTTLCFFVLPETGIKANAAAGAAVSVAGNANAYNRVDDVIIVVPETIYMTPSTGASTTGQYYVNNVVDASGKVTLDVSSNADSGKLSICAPGATSATFQVVDAKTGKTVGEPKVTGEGTAIALSNGYASKTDIKLESIATGLTAGQTATIQWNVTLTYSDKTVTYRAFTTLYAPWYTPVGAATRAYSEKDRAIEGRRQYCASMAWISGIHGYVANADDGKYWIAATDQTLANESADVTSRGTYYARIKGRYMVPLITGVANGADNEDNVTSWLSSSKTEETVNDATFRFFNLEVNNGGIVVADVSPVATMTVDTSRYSNFNQIPNLTIGFNATDTEHSSGIYWYISDFTKIANDATNASGTYKFYNWTKEQSRGDVVNQESAWFKNGAEGVIISGSADNTGSVNVGQEYNGTWNRSIEKGSAYYDYMIKGALHAYNDYNRGYSINYVQLRATNVDKSALRNLVLQATSINRLNYVNNFEHFDIDIAYAAYVLGNPAATAADVSTAITRLQKSTNGCKAGEHPGNSDWECPGLKIDVYARRNHAANDNAEVKHDTVVIGTNTVYSYTPSATPEARAGYDFKGWNADRNASTGSVPASISLYATDKSVYAIWTIKQYTMTFDTKGGTAIAPVTKNYGEQISAPAAPTKTGHTFAGWNVTFPHTILNNITATAEWTVNKYIITFDSVGGSPVDSMAYDYEAKITAPADPVKTGYNFKGWSPALPETMPANNLPVSAVWEANNYTITYDLNTDGVEGAVLGAGVTSYTIEDTVTLPSATSTNYNFIGWEVTAVENGNWVTKLYEAGDTVSKVYGNVTLRAKWDIKKYTVNWVNWNGIVIETDTVNYGALPSFDQTAIPTKPADAEFTYTFKGWDKSLYNPVTEDITFTAQYESSTNSYTVTWYDSDGTKLSEQTYLYGETPVYPNAAPTKTDPSGRLTYTFAGWTPAIGTVEGNASYTAQYESRVNTYTVTFTYRDKDGNEKTVTINDVEHGTSFSSLVPADCAEYYNGASTGFEHSHYKRSWKNAAEAVTAAADFVAEYTLLDNVTMSFTDAYRASDCENTGLNSRECTHCGYKYEEEIPAKGHDWKLAADSATCLADGVKTYTCSRCPETKEEHSAAKGHGFTTTIAAIPVTCITDGYASYKSCLVCGLYFGADEGAMSGNGKTDTSDFKEEAQGHKFTLTAEAPATCEENGHEAYYTCSVCKLHFAADADVMAEGGETGLDSFTITKRGHDYKGVVTAPTCTAQGYTTYTCQNDPTHTYVSDYVDAKGHTPGAPVSENIKNATCTVKGSYEEVIYCTVKNCTEGVEYFEISRTTKNTYLPHDFVEIIVDGLEGQLKAEKTCYSYAEYYKVCSMCKKEMSTETFFYVDGGKLEHTEAQAVIMNKTTATCTAPAEWDEVVYCSVEACKYQISSTHVTGEKNPDNHADHKTTTTISNEVPGTCVSERTWTETVTCNGCTKVISTTDKVGNKNVLNHVSEAEGEAYVDTPGTCISETIWRVDTICSACKDKTKTRTYKGEKNPDKHTGGTDVTIENSVDGTCITPNTWQVVTCCLGCSVELSRIDKTGSIAPDNHTAETYTREENLVAGTCTSEKTWDIVTYCSDCNKAVSTEHKTGEKDPANHSGVTELRGNKEATCGAEGYTGDIYWICCEKLEAKGEILPIVAQHSPGDPVRENEIPATETTDGEFDSVVYCSVCSQELSREHVIHKIERTIRFVLKDKTIEVKAFSGDIVEAPETPEVQTADGFWHYFLNWDKRIKPVTGDATYTAIYTEPCDYSELEELEAQLKEILADGTVDDATIEANKAEIEATLAEIKRVYMDRNYRDVSEQNEITEVTDRIEALIQVICPDLGAKLVIEGSLVQYTGQNLALRAVKMPSGVEVFDAEWTTSDDSIVFFSNGKLYAIGTGTVTVTAKRGSLTASKTITIVEGGNTRGINFTSVDNTSIILEDAYQTKDGEIVFWSDDQPIRFRVHLSPSFLYEKYFVYINGEAAEMDMDGYYTIPANSGDVQITIAGEMIDTGAGEGPTVTKWSFWDWLLSFFRKIGDFFRGLFS